MKYAMVYDDGRVFLSIPDDDFRKELIELTKTMTVEEALDHIQQELKQKTRYM